MKTRHKFLLAFAGVHLILVAFGAAEKKPLSPMTPHGSAVGLYSSLSGADNGYGFFAPGVGSQIRTKFKLTDKDGQTWNDTLDLGSTAEANLRFTGLSNLLPTLREEQRLRILQSMAATMFGKHPTAKTVTVRIDLWGFDRNENEADFPTMAEYRDGKKPQWLPMMEVTFTRSNVKEIQPTK